MLVSSNDDRGISSQKGTDVDIVQKDECAWEAPSFTFEMLFDYLSEHGFDVVQRPLRAIRFSDAVSLDELAAMVAKEEGEEDRQADASSVSQACLVVFEGEASGFCREGVLDALSKASDMGLPVLGTVSESYPSSFFEEASESSRFSFGLVSPDWAEGEIAPHRVNLLYLVIRFLLDTRSLVDRLSTAAGERGSFQSLVDVAESRFGCFANITDAHYRLLACTKHHQPDDEINQSLIDLGYHCEEHLRRQNTMGYLLKSVASQHDAKVWPPDDTFPYFLLTGVMHVSGQYAGHVLVAHPSRPTQGEFDEFRIFLAYCERFARRSLGCISLRESPRQALVSQLASTREVDGAFARERAELLGLPVTGVFALARLACNDAFGGQVGHIAEDLDSRLSIEHVTFVREGQANVLLCAASVEKLWGALVSAGKVEYGLTQATLLISDPFYRLSGLFYASREVDVVAHYEGEIMLSLRAAEPEGDGVRTFSNGRTRILSFRDAFSFYWQSSRDDEGLLSFVLSHLLVTSIADDDKRMAALESSEKMESLALLLVFLSNERKATRVGKMCGLHRNGVLYRIQKIEKDFGIDLGDAMTREYLLASIRAKLASSCDFRERFDCALSTLLGKSRY